MRGSIAATTVVVGLSVAYSLAFVSIYTRPNTRMTASVWIYQNVPNGATLVAQVAEPASSVCLSFSMAATQAARSPSA